MFGKTTAYLMKYIVESGTFEYRFYELSYLILIDKIQ